MGPHLVMATALAAGLCALVTATAAAKTAGADPISAVAAGSDGAWVALGSYELVHVDARTNRITSRSPVGPGYVTDLAVGAGGVWASGVCGRISCDYGTLVRFDPRTGRRSRPLTRLGGMHPRAIATGHGAVWVLGARRVLRIDPGTRRLAGPPISVGRNAQDIAVGAGLVWVTTAPPRGRAGRCALTGIAPGSGRIVRRQALPCTPRSLAFAAGGLWATGSPEGRRLVAISPRGGMRAAPGVRLPASSAVAAGGGRLWVTGVRDVATRPTGERRGVAVLTSVDPRTGTMGPSLRLGPAFPGWTPLAVGARSVWVANAPPGTLARVDPGTGRVVARTRFRAAP